MAPSRVGGTGRTSGTRQTAGITSATSSTSSSTTSSTATSAATSAGTRQRPGRRPGRSGTKASILQAAKAEFAEKGFDKATVRSIAATAGVDPALIHHYYGSKDDLLLAALEVPFDPRRLLPALTAAGLDGLGSRIATQFLSVWDDEDMQAPLVAVLRSSLTTPAAAAQLREGLVRMVMSPLIELLGEEDAPLRAQLVASQLLGLAVTRYVLRLQPLADTDASVVAVRIGPTLQRYLEGSAT